MPSSTSQMMFSTGNKGDNGLWDNKEAIHQEENPNEEDFNKATHHSKVIKDTKVIKVIKVINNKVIDKVTRGIHKEETNNEATFEASQISEATQTNLVTHWTLATMP